MGQDPPGKLPEVVQVLVRDGVNNRPVDRSVGVDGHIANADGPLQIVGELCRNDPHVPAMLKGLRHGLRRRPIGLRNEVGGHVDAQLHGPRQVYGENVLRVPVPVELVPGPTGIDFVPFEEIRSESTSSLRSGRFSREASSE